MKINLDDVVHLFTGDIKEDATSDILEKWGRRLKAQVLKVSHHGTDNTTPTPFLEPVLPDRRDG